VIPPGKRPDWISLFRIACDLIRQVNSETKIIDRWTFGGGTALMLQIDHRESHDVDLFLDDPQLLGFLDPEKHDLNFELEPTAYYGDGASFLKFTFEGIGEIDFIVSQPLTVQPSHQREIQGEKSLLETVPEIITKKIVHRGSSINPRDILMLLRQGKGIATQSLTRCVPTELMFAKQSERLSNSIPSS
jgi:hypothetical protein